MAKAKLTFKILSYWHAGTGMGEGANLDAVVNKTASGLPYLPGKTVKGLFKEALLTLFECGRLSNETILSCLGGAGSNRYDSGMACLEFSNATLEEKMEAWATQSANQNKCRHFFRRISSTSIDNNGLAEKEALRTIEVTVPLTLTATVELNSADKAWIEDFKKAAPLLRYIGTQRHRGLGRAIVTVTDTDAEVNL